MESKEVLSALQVFNKYVVSQSRANLTRQKKNATRKLYNSISAQAQVFPKSFTNSISMEEYGEFQDQGVKGAISSVKTPNSPFRFGSGTGQKGGLTKGINAWVRLKRFQFKDRRTGKFLSYEQTAQLIIRSIYNKGIAPTKFLSKPFEAAFQKLPDEIVEAYGLDVEKFLTFTLNRDVKRNG